MPAAEPPQQPSSLTEKLNGSIGLVRDLVQWCSTSMQSTFLIAKSCLNCDDMAGSMPLRPLFRISRGRWHASLVRTPSDSCCTTIDCVSTPESGLVYVNRSDSHIEQRCLRRVKRVIPGSPAESSAIQVFITLADLCAATYVCFAFL